MNTESTSKNIIEDFLEADDPIRGQGYVCLSFISPENVLKNKNLFMVRRFLANLINEKNINLDKEFLDTIDEKFDDFLYTRSESLEKEFSEKNDFQTTVRGVKVRGVYDTMQEAQVRAKLLQKKDKNFNVFVGQVGFWLPWDPNPHNIENQEYFESELNELVKKYKENQDSKDDHFREHVDYVKEQAIKDSKIAKEKNNQLDEITEKLEEEDPWLASKK
tara:strand:+ start:1303 stop:1959 length:657 start_codon:yes stop_codon:yes gene_type:complete